MNIIAKAKTKIISNKSQQTHCQILLREQKLSVTALKPKVILFSSKLHMMCKVNSQTPVSPSPMITNKNLVKIQN